MAKFNIISQFLKDISFESPNVPDLFFKQDNGQAELEINIDSDSTVLTRKMRDGEFDNVYIINAKTAIVTEEIIIINFFFGNFLVPKIFSEDSS